MSDQPTDAQERVLVDLREIIAEVIGDEYVAEIEIGMTTSFYEDLEIESIELVALAEELQAKYGDSIDFAGWIAGMEVDEIIAMSVGRLVDYIVEQTCRS
ncbi:MAG TPA: phosphopantetheine-binding protein [Acidimicrobiales bacterium]|nr:phosphopantetheine-binding protein [Acidimicrobiales bacterium]